MKTRFIYLAIFVFFTAVCGGNITLPASGWTKQNGIKNITAKGNSVTAVVPAGTKDPFIYTRIPPLDASRYDKLELQLQLPPDAPDRCDIYFATEESKGFRQYTAVPFRIAADGQFKLVVLNLKKNKHWKGKVTALRLDLPPRPAKDMTFSFRDVTFIENPPPLSRAVQLRSWRLKSANLNARMFDEYNNEKFPVKVDYSGGKPGRLKLARHELHAPADNWIPPFVGSDARLLKIRVLPVECKGNASAFLELRVRGKDAKSHRWIRKKIDFNSKNWQDIAVELNCSPANRLADVDFAVTGNKQSSCTFYFAGATVVRQNGSTYKLLNDREPSHMTGYDPATFPSAKIKPLPRRPVIAIGTGTYYFLYGRKYLKEFAQMAKEEFPDFDFMYSVGQTPEPDSVNILRDLPENMYVQFQNCRHGLDYMALFDELPRDWRGEPQRIRFNSTIATSPILQRSISNTFEYANKIGFNNFAVIDYVWNYLGGRWGYDKCTIAAFRDDLSGRDEGLELEPANGEKRSKIHFWDYYEDYHGIRLTPADLKLKSFDEYFPVTERELPKLGETGQKNYGVFLALCNYEWLRQAQRFNRIAARHKGNFDYILNGETWLNANDHVYLLKLKGTGIVSPEYFSGYLLNSDCIYRMHGTYIRQAEKLGRQFGIITETSRGGTGQPYWSPMTGYAVNYSLSGMGFHSWHYDHIGPDDWPKANTPGETQERINYQLFRAEAHAYAQAKREKTRKVSALEILDVYPRGTVFRSWGTTAPGDVNSWGPYLLKAQLNYERTDHLELPQLLNNARVIFYSSPTTSAKTVDALKKWLASGGKTLIMHSGVPYDSPKGFPNLHELQKNRKINYSKPLFEEFSKRDPGKCVLSDSNGKPLLRVIDRPDKSRICYMPVSPSAVSGKDMEKLMTCLTGILKLPTVQQFRPGELPTVLRYENPVCSVAVLFDKQAAVDANKNIKTWYNTKWAKINPRNNAQLKKSAFDYDNYLYSFKQPEKNVHAVLDDIPAGNYRIYRFLADREETVKVDKTLCLTLPGQLAEVFYFSADTPEFRNYIKTLKEKRQKLEPFFAEVR